jgi:hypothetical protein
MNQGDIWGTPPAPAESTNLTKAELVESMEQEIVTQPTERSAAERLSAADRDVRGDLERQRVTYLPPLAEQPSRGLPFGGIIGKVLAVILIAPIFIVGASYYSVAAFDAGRDGCRWGPPTETQCGFVGATDESDPAFYYWPGFQLGRLFSD